MGRVSEYTPLTPGQEAFCQAYTELNSGRQAYLRTYPKSLNWKDNSVDSAASELLALRKVSERVAEIRQRALYKADISQQRVLEELKCLSFIDPAELFNLKTGTLIPVYELPEATRRAIASFEAIELPLGKKNGDGTPQRRYKFKYKFWNKPQSIDMVNKHLGLYEADNAQKALGQALALVLSCFPGEVVDSIRQTVMAKAGLLGGGQGEIVELPATTENNNAEG